METWGSLERKIKLKKDPLEGKRSNSRVTNL